MAILAVLASLLLPALSQAKRRAQGAYCLGIERQLGIAMRSVLDNQTGGALNGNVLLSWWMTDTQLATGARLCPSAPPRRRPGAQMLSNTGWLGTANAAWLLGLKEKQVPTILTPVNSSDDINGLLPGSYALNGWLDFPDLVLWVEASQNKLLLPEEPFLNEANIAEPALTPAFCDSVIWSVWPKAADWKPYSLYYGVQAQNGGIFAYSHMQAVAIARHSSKPASPPGHFDKSKPLSGAVHVAFFDGHAERVPLEQLWRLSWHRNYKPPAKPLVLP